MDQNETTPQDDAPPTWLSNEPFEAAAKTEDNANPEPFNVEPTPPTEVAALPPLQLAQKITGILSLTLTPVSVILVCLWIQDEDMGGGGVSWAKGDARRVFNWHPVLMVLAYAFMNVGALIFKMSGTASYPTALLSKSLNSAPVLSPMDQKNERRRKIVKVLHVCVWSLSILFGVTAMLAVFKSHNDPLSGFIANLYSLHSWVGVLVMSLYSLQFLVGIFAFGGLLSRTRRSLSFLMEIHKYMGAHIHILVTATILLGIQEKEGFVQCWYDVEQADMFPLSNYGKIPSSCKISHGLGIVVLAMGIFTSFSLYHFPLLTKGTS